MVHPYLRRQERRGAGDLPEPRGRERPQAHARRADLPGAGDAARHRRSGFHARRGGPPAPGDGGLEAQGRARPVRGAAHPRHARARLRGGVRATDLPADPGLRRIRVSGMRRRRDAGGGRGYWALADHRRDRLRSRSSGKYARMRRPAALAKAQGARRGSERREARMAVAYGAGSYDHCNGRASVHDDGWMAATRRTSGWRLRRSSALHSGLGSSPMAAPSDPRPCRPDRRGQSVPSQYVLFLHDRFMASR